MIKNLLTLNFSFQGVPTEPFEEGHHNHYQGSVREQLEEDDTFEQVIILVNINIIDASKISLSLFRMFTSN